MNQLTAPGIKVIWVDAVTIEQVADALRQLAAWSPKPEQAKQAAQTMLDDYALLKSRYANKPKKRVFLQFGANPLFTSGKGSIQHEVLEVCGGENIFAGSRVPRHRLAVSRSSHERPSYCCNRRAVRNSEN